MQRITVIACVFLGLAQGLTKDEPAVSRPSAGTNAVMGTAGRKIFLDPKTGKVVPSPKQAPALPPAVGEALSTSSEGLREVPGKTRGGGTKVHLQGRFRSSVQVSVGPDGKVKSRCTTTSEAAHTHP